MNKTKITAKIIISYVLLLSWALVIFFFSAKNADESTVQSNFILQIISRLTGITLQENTFWAVSEVVVRKLAHLSVFLLLGVLATNAFRLTFKNKKEFIFALAFCFLYSVSDEIHQYFVPGRACRFYDVIVDTIGACLGISIFPFLRRLLLSLFKRSDKVEKA